MALLASMPESYATAGAALGAMAQQFEATGRSVDEISQQLGTSWTGSARDAYGRTAQSTSRTLATAAQALRQAASVSSEGAQSLQACVTELRGYVEMATGSGFLVLPTGTVMVGPAQYAEAASAGPGAPAVLASYEAVAAEFTMVITTSVEMATVTDTETAAQLRASLDTLVEQGSVDPKLLVGAGKGGKSKSPLGGKESGPWVFDAKNVKLGGAISQSKPGSCISAAGSMLVDGQYSEAELLGQLGEWSDPTSLAAELNRRAGSKVWTGGYVADGRPLVQRGKVVAVLHAGPAGHAVVIEPMGPGKYFVRDPLPGATYEVDDAWVEKYVAGGVWR